MRYSKCHGDRAHYCKGLCESCYRRSWRKTAVGRATARRNMKTWKDKIRAEGRRVKSKVRITERVSNQGACQICLAVEPDDKKFFIDHDHSVVPAVARGLLCPPCNTALGFVESLMRKNLLQFAIAYAETHGWERAA